MQAAELTIRLHLPLVLAGVITAASMEIASQSLGGQAELFAELEPLMGDAE